MTVDIGDAILGLEVEVNPNRKGEHMANMPPPLKPPRKPKLPRPKKHKLLTKRQRMIGKVVCAILPHKTIQLTWVDSHGGLDGMSQCVRCGALDV